MSLYLKYRPKTIEELDLAGVRKTLGDMVAGNKLAHAYLFTGPRGAGKTSAARILARIVNCEKNAKKLGEPCNECDSCVSILTGAAVDVVEIDAASNRGIDDIRELKEKIRLSPAILRKKVYIIDEVHMLTTEAFNALLKTLEEPPEHAVFILCTTESHKVPETISSRCVRVNFTKATKDEMKRSFARVVAGEKAAIDEEALEVIAAAVDGSFRDGVKILDTAIASGAKVGLAEIEILIYGSSGFKSQELSRSFMDRDLERALTLFHRAIEEGVDLVYLTVAVMKDLRDEILATHDKSLIELVYKLDEAARKIALSPLPQVLVEMVIVEWCGEGEGKTSIRNSRDDKADLKSVSASSNVAGPVGGVDAGEAWNKLIASLNGDSYSLGALLSKARPGTIQGNLLTIEMAHEFHKEQLMQEKFRARVEKLVSDAVGRAMRVECVVVSGTAQGRGKLQTRPIVDTISQVAPGENELIEAAEEIFSA